jgi:hypothetical protein
MSDEEKLNFRILHIQMVIQLLQNRSVLQASTAGFCSLIGRTAGMCPECWLGLLQQSWITVVFPYFISMCIFRYYASSPFMYPLANIETNNLFELGA